MQSEETLKHLIRSQALTPAKRANAMPARRTIPRTLYCSICNKKFKKTSNFSRHVKDGVCKRKLHKTMTEHYDIIDGKHICRTCDLKYATYKAYREHLQIGRCNKWAKIKRLKAGATIEDIEKPSELAVPLPSKPDEGHAPPEEDKCELLRPNTDDVLPNANKSESVRPKADVVSPDEEPPDFAKEKVSSEFVSKTSAVCATTPERIETTPNDCVAEHSSSKRMLEPHDSLIPITPLEQLDSPRSSQQGYVRSFPGAASNIHDVDPLHDDNNEPWLMCPISIEDQALVEKAEDIYDAAMSQTTSQGYAKLAHVLEQVLKKRDVEMKELRADVREVGTNVKQLMAVSDKTYSAVTKTTAMLPPLPAEKKPIKNKILFAIKEDIKKKNINLDNDFIDKVADYLARQNNPRTRSSYKGILLSYAEFLKPGVLPTTTNMEEFLDSQRGVALTTIGMRRATLLSFVKGMYGWNPTTTVRVEPSNYTPPKPIYAPSVQTVGKMMRYFVYKKLRIMALFTWFGYAIGQRVNDILQTRLCNFSTTVTGHWMVHGNASKTLKPYVKYIPLGLARAIQELVSDPAERIFNFTKKTVETAFREATTELSEYLKGRDFYAKHLRAGHILVLCQYGLPGMQAGDHTKLAVTLNNYVGSGVLQLFNLDKYYYSGVEASGEGDHYMPCEPDPSSVHTPSSAPPTSRRSKEAKQTPPQDMPEPMFQTPERQRQTLIHTPGGEYMNDELGEVSTITGSMQEQKLTRNEIQFIPKPQHAQILTDAENKPIGYQTSKKGIVLFPAEAKLVYLQGSIAGYYLPKAKEQVSVYIYS